MWYFTWLLGILLASSVAIINVMWLELNVMDDDDDEDLH
jgi:cyd operon protein YbgT